MSKNDDSSRGSGGESVADAHEAADASKSPVDTPGSGGSGGQSRREVLQSTGAIGIGGLIGSGATAAGLGGTASAASSVEPWTLVAIPDTQVHTATKYDQDDRRLSYTESMVEWIQENADDVAFVSHMGDIVQNGSHEEEWDRADQALSPLDDTVPWSPCVGNHDYHKASENGDATNFKTHFGAHRFEDKDWFGGTGPHGTNFYQTFSAGGYEFLHLSLEFFPDGTREPDNSDLPIGWANDVLEEHSDKPTIVTTHFYLGNTDVNVAGIGNEIRDSLVNPNPQVFMVLNGHHTVENHHVHQNDAGENVYAAVTDYQAWSHGYTGMFRQFHFIPGGGDDAPDRIKVKTYSHHPEERGYYQDVLDSGRKAEWHWDLDFDERFGDGSSPPSPPEEQGPYNGPHPVPGTIEAEHFDTGGEGVAYHDTTDDHYGSDYRNDEAVDVQSSEEHGYNVGWMEAGEWLEYTVQVDRDGDYAVRARVASPANGGSLAVSAEDDSASSSFAETGGWQSWTTVDLGTLSLSAGETVVRVDATDSAWNFNYLEFEAVSGDSEGLHVVDDTTARVVWKPEFDVTWNNYVYFGSAVADEPREWQLMDETTENVFETTLGGLSAGDTIDYQFSYWANDAWQTTDPVTTTFDPVGSSGPGTNRLVHGESNVLHPDEHLESANGDYRLYFQASDGNLVLRDESTGDALWATMTNGDGGIRLPLQGDGNLVMYTDGGDAVWASDTAGSGANELVLEDDGVLALYDDETTIWSVNE